MKQNKINPHTWSFWSSDSHEIGLEGMDSSKRGDSDHIIHSEMGSREDISNLKQRTNEEVLTTEIPSRMNKRWTHSLASNDFKILQISNLLQCTSVIIISFYLTTIVNPFPFAITS